MKKYVGFGCALLLTVFLFPSCKKGNTGPEGPMGNADIKMYTFGSKTFSASADYKITGLTQGKVDSSLVLVYYNPSTEPATAWYPCPGLGSGAFYDTRYFFNVTNAATGEWTLVLRLMKADGSGPYATQVTFTKLRIILAPASIITAGRGNPPVDLNNYDAVKSYFKLPD